MSVWSVPMKASLKQLLWITTAGVALVLAGCSGGSDGSSGGGSGGGGSGGGGGNNTTLTSSARGIFETQCADCHGPGGQGGSAPNLVTNESSISELEARLQDLASGEQAADRSTALTIATLLRNRKNIVEMLRRERFI